uniref:Uncharacterized protein n=1 Tax=Picea glauca TaxID=3330 RepID=A0A117NI61_PICGL|nr:hypothetical protein ABT39_MTgene3936 [Picea glauca]QHR91051.1 hypothetical protein Q903MT_gene5083 [Picea sitchensis]
MSDFLDALKVGRRTAKSWAKSAGGPKELTATLSLPVLKGVITYINICSMHHCFSGLFLDISSSRSSTGRLRSLVTVLAQKSKW